MVASLASPNTVVSTNAHALVDFAVNAVGTVVMNALVTNAVSSTHASIEGCMHHNREHADLRPASSLTFNQISMLIFMVIQHQWPLCGMLHAGKPVSWGS